jgi:hypothetical protein
VELSELWFSWQVLQKSFQFLQRKFVELLEMKQYALDD